MYDNKYISWTSFCQAMNSIAYWIVQNKKKYKKRDHYQILTLKGNCKDIEKKAKKLGSDKLVAMYTMALIKDNKSLDFLPNYVTLKNGEQIDKAEYVDMAIDTILQQQVTDIKTGLDNLDKITKNAVANLYQNYVI